MTDIHIEPGIRTRLQHLGLVILIHEDFEPVVCRSLKASLDNAKNKIGAELGVEAMSLYHYVSNKDDLLDAVLDQLYDKIELPEVDAEADWEEPLRMALRSFNQVMLSHPGSLELFVNRPGRSLSAFRVLRWALARFHHAGLDVRQAGQAFYFCVSYVLGHAATEFGSMRRLRSGLTIDTSVVEDDDFAVFVNLSQTISSEEIFERGLDSLVAGLRASYNLA